MKLNKDKNGRVISVTVEKGDTLSAIAKKCNTTVNKLASLNKISNVNLIYPGQVIKLTTSSTSSSSSSSSTKSSSSSSSNKAKIDHFGVQANTDRTVFATWSWGKDHTAHYKVTWHYATGDGVWFVGHEGDENAKQSIYSAPSNATKVKFKVKPVSSTHKVNKKDTSYWTASWSDEKEYKFTSNPPTTPPVPTVTIENLRLKAELDNLDVNGTEIQFQVVKDDSTVFVTGSATITQRHAEYSCAVNTGSKYKVRCRAVRSKEYSDWSDYSSSAGTPPNSPPGFDSVKALTKTEVQLEWKTVNNAKNYVVEWTTEKRYFDSSNSVQSMTVDATSVGHAEVTGLEPGHEYFFRVKATNEYGDSPWSEIVSIILGQAPAAPTTWSSTTTAIVGEPLNLYWVHNAKDGSTQLYAELELTVNGHSTVQTIHNDNYDNEDEKDKTSRYSIDTSAFVEGAKIEWRVRTCGITRDYGDWSIMRTVDIYARPSLELSMLNINGSQINVLEQFPFYIRGIAGPSSQLPVGYHVAITSNEAYETVDNIGNEKHISEGDEVYSRYFDTSDDLLIELSAGNIDLENNVEYTIRVSVSMNSGLNAESEVIFTVSWTDEIYDPNAEIGIDNETMTASIMPYCSYYPDVYYQVILSGGVYKKQSTAIEVIDGNPVETEIRNADGDICIDTAITDTNEIVYSGVLNGSRVYFCIVESDTPELVDGVTLAVYRREYDGTFTEIASGLDNNGTYITDPHPALDYARYRIVATSKATGAVSFYDPPGYPVGETAVIIQWNEKWTKFNTTTEDELEQPPWSGSMLRLPYNIDVSDKRSLDVQLIEYVGRRHPVSYYGTHVGETATWSMDVPKSDVDTLYALRRLAIYMGDVYVREPSGSGYWANINVSFNRNHKELIMPVSLDIKRVEGGM